VIDIKTNTDLSQETTVCSDWRNGQKHLSVLAPLRVTLIVMKKRPFIVVIYSSWGRSNVLFFSSATRFLAETP